MITKIDIRNRQSHQHTTLDLADGVNLLVGQGDSGKSAILRSLFWPIYNTAGDSQVSNWAKKITKGGKVALTDESSVTVTKPQGALVRFRNPTENGYTVNGETLKAVGTGVPDQVSSFFNLSDVNIARQHSPYFLIDLPGGQVSAYLNRVVKMEEIDSYLSAAAGCLKDARAKHKSLQDAQEQDAKTLEGLGWIDGVQARLDSVDALERDLKAAMSRRHGLLDWTRQFADATEAKAKAAQVASLESKVAEVRKLQQASMGVGTRLKSVKGLREAWQACTVELERSSRVASLEAKAKGVRVAVEGLESANRKLAGVQLVRLSWGRLVREVATASKVAKLSEKLDSVRSMVQEHLATQSRLAALVALRSKWADASKAMRGEGVLDGLEAKAKRTRKLWDKYLEVSKRLASLKQWGLTFQGVHATLVKSRAEVVELTSKRPETCPYCGAGNHKGKGC